VVLLFGATGAIAELQDALNTAWGVQPDPNKGGVKSFFLKRLLSLALVAGIAFLLLVSLLLTTAITISEKWLPGQISAPLLYGVNVAADLIVITLLFAAIFKFLPDAQVAWRDVWIGAAVTAGLFILGKFGLGVYLGNSNVASAYGAAGSLVLVLVWIYYSALILLLGAEFTQVWARERGKRVRAEEGAVRVVRQTKPVPDGSLAPKTQTPNTEKSVEKSHVA
jgi:membrane protein